MFFLILSTYVNNCVLLKFSHSVIYTFWARTLGKKKRVYLLLSKLISLKRLHILKMAFLPSSWVISRWRFQEKVLRSAGPKADWRNHIVISEMWCLAIPGDNFCATRDNASYIMLERIKTVNPNCSYTLLELSSSCLKARHHSNI